jgi:ABC-type multidrug transport system fused ATPase/permease subunit
MLKIIKELFSLLTPRQRKRFYALQAQVIIMAFAEIVSIASIVPFMALVGDLSILEGDNLLGALYLKSNVVDEYQFIFYLGIIVLFTLILAASTSMYITWRVSMFANDVGAEISHRLYSYYLNQDWLFHTMGSSSNLIKKISTESTRVTHEVLLPLMQMNSRIILISFILLIIFFYDPIVVIAGFIVFSVPYIILFKFVQKLLASNSKNISSMFVERFRLMSEGFGGIKDVLLLGRSGDFKKRFFKAGNKLAHAQGTNAAIAAVPRYFMELLAFGSMVGLVLYLVKASEGNLGVLLPTLSVYALAGFKLLPALQQTYGSIARIKGNLSAYDSIREDLKDINAENGIEVQTNQQVWSKHNEINLKDITFCYPNKIIPALKSVSLTIKPNSTVGFIGTSGSGKSTLADVIIGLIKPQQGEINIDGVPLIKNNSRAWKNKIGFVPQSIFLTEGTIAENVAFGVQQDLIDYDQVEKALKLAHMKEWVSGLDLGTQTKVGERGVQLSGGQRQRIGIARALYYEADVLVFDEATSALDGITEKIVMEAIHEFKGQKTLIMIAHRLKTIQKCDQIFMMEKGCVIANGTYQQLLEKNEMFKKMSKNA